MSNPNSIQQAYQHLVDQLTTRYDVREANNISAILFEDAFGIRNFRRQDELAETQQKELMEMTQRLLQYEPVQYVLGLADFYGLKLRVDQRVLIPRPETEELVALVMETMEERAEQPWRVLDIGTGSGCIPLALKKQRPDWQLWGYDVSEGALEIARSNALQLGLEVEWAVVDILDKDKWPTLNFDIIISNPPYIPPSEKSLMPPQVLNYEPGLALFAPEDQADIFYRTILDFAQIHLAENGVLFFECNEYNAPEVFAYAQARGWQGALHEDMSGKPRMLSLNRRPSY